MGTVCVLASQWIALACSACHHSTAPTLAAAAAGCPSIDSAFIHTRTSSDTVTSVSVCVCVRFIAGDAQWPVTAAAAAGSSAALHRPIDLLLALSEMVEKARAELSVERKGERNRGKERLQLNSSRRAKCGWYHHQCALWRQKEDCSCCCSWSLLSSALQLLYSSPVFDARLAWLMPSLVQCRGTSSSACHPVLLPSLDDDYGANPRAERERKVVVPLQLLQAGVHLSQ